MKDRTWESSLGETLEALAADIQVAEVIKTVRSKDCMELPETGKDIKKEQAGAGGSWDREPPKKVVWVIGSNSIKQEVCSFYGSIANLESRIH